ncbi:MAG: sensor histidine kinase [Saprospiraceae bacterium]|nr:sensor histidine kinase [Saprospiraceae bacterium]
MKSRLVFALFLFLVPLTQNGQNPQVIDSLEQVLQTLSGKDRFSTLLELARETQINAPNQAAEYIEQAEAYVNKAEDNEALFDFYSYAARVKLYQHQYTESIELGKQALAVEFDELDPKDHIHVYATIGTNHYYTTNYEQAIEAHLNSLRIADSLKIESEKANIFNNISVVYMGLQNWEKAEDYLNQAIAKGKTTNRLDQATRGTSNLAIVYAIQQKYAASEAMFLEDIEINKVLGNQLAVCRSTGNLGQLYEEQGLFQKSLEFYQKGLDMALEIDDLSSIAIGYQNVGAAYMNLGDFEKANQQLEIGLKKTKELGNINFHRDGLLTASALYERMGKGDKALEYFKAYSALNDSLLNENRMKAVTELEEKYESEKKEKEILKQEASINRQKGWIFGLSGTLAAAIGLFFALSKMNQARANSQKQQALIEAITETQIAERKRIAQDLHDSIGAMLSLTSSQLKTKVQENQLQPEILQGPIEMLKKTATQVRSISHNMMPAELMKFGLVSAMQTSLDSISSEDLNIRFHHHNMEHRIEEVKEVQVYRIFQEILQNVLKHAQAKSLTVDLNKYAKHLSLMIEDDGQGFDMTQQKAGLGLRSINTRIDYLNGLFNIDSQEGRGTIFNIEIPI